MLCGTLWEVFKNPLFQWGHFKIAVNLNVKFHIKKSVSSFFPHELYTIGEVTSKPGQTSKMKLFQKKTKKTVNSFRSLDVSMGSERTFGWHIKGVLCNTAKSSDPTKLQKRIWKEYFSWK